MNLPEFRRRSTIIGRADLVTACDNSAVFAHIAGQLGWSYHKPELPTDAGMLSEGFGEPEFVLPSGQIPRIDSSDYPHGILDTALWLPTTYLELRPLPEQPPANTEEVCDWTDFPAPPKHRPLAPWSVLRSRLRNVHQRNSDGAIDLPRLINKLAWRELVVRFPRLPARRWADRLTVVMDTSIRLIPYEFDQRDVVQHLRKEMPAGRVALLCGNHPRRLSRSNQRRPPAIDGQSVSQDPEPGRDVLVLGDLGILAPSRHAVAEWLMWGKRQQMRGCTLHALVPCQPDQIPKQLRSIFSIHGWQHRPVSSVRSPKQRQQLVEQLLTLASPAIRVEPGLLRELRLLLPEATDASLEAAFWLSHRLISRHPEAATLDSDTVEELRPSFETLDDETRQRILQLIRAWHLPLETGGRVWTAEYASLSEDSKRLLPPSDHDNAQRCIRQLDHDRQLTEQRFGRDVAGFCFRRSVVLTDPAFRDSVFGKTLSRWRHEYHPREDVAAGISDPRDLPGGKLRTLAIQMDDAHISVAVSTPSESFGLQPILNLKSTNGVVRVADSSSGVFPVSRDSFWKTTQPEFVSDYGTDQYGAWCEVRIPRLYGRKQGDLVTHRFRWIPAGTFLMGSPEDEPERRTNEGPQHEVTLSRGFWMAETVCTQNLWSAIMHDNPSHFQGDDRPVEQMSWEHVQDFLSKVNIALPGIALQLPTEAQWEYACRAGTTTPFYTGLTITTEQSNYNGLNPYAGGVKGQYRRQTVAVRTFAPNQWGLHEMHGNVWEWCSDWYAEDYYSSTLTVDPEGPKRGSYRVVRGGSWVSFARFVRSACRYWGGPGLRSDGLGFRLLSSAMAEPSEVAKVPVAEQGPQRTNGGEAEHLFHVVDKQAEPIRRALTVCSRRCVSSDLEEVGFERVIKPDWAVDFGRDRFGAFATFEVPGRDGHGGVRQQMRWIPPGQFVMGSPDDEPGRFENEKQHLVTISQGFWMFDTPCTQQLWETVTGENPGYFSDPLRPVEQVTWNAVTKFAEQLSSVTKGLTFALPTESQWEYACRAGTTTAIFSGPIDILGQHNAPALDPVAWYGGNSGVDYDHPKFHSASGWKDKQYEFDKAGTRRVKQKAPNPWGLYDMLGNVWEWCSDWYSEYGDKALMGGSHRVVRGGCWIGSARVVRSACRYRYAPGFRSSYLGFRLLSSASPVQSGTPSQ